MQHTESGQIELECAADLARHQRAVNVVRWSPNGELLASGDDESVIFIWKLKGENEATNILGEFYEQTFFFSLLVGTWYVLHSLRLVTFFRWTISRITTHIPANCSDLSLFIATFIVNSVN